MRFLKLRRYNLRPLEEELDRIGWEKHDIEPRLQTMPSLGLFDEEIGFDYEKDEDE